MRRGEELRGAVLAGWEVGFPYDWSVWPGWEVSRWEEAEAVGEGGMPVLEFWVTVDRAEGE